MHEWINEWMKLLSSLPNPFGFCTSLALSNPAWLLAHWSIEIALLKLANNPFITKPNSQDISVAFDKPSLKFLCYWFLGGWVNLVFFLHIWSLLLCLFPLLLLLYLTSCLGGSSLFEYYTTHPEISTANSRWINVNLHSYSQLLLELQVDMLYISKWGFTVTSNSLWFNNKSINFLLPQFYISANEA